jgi:HPt (histidine-containing phosphotransfer) domain-containing protein
MLINKEDALARLDNDTELYKDLITMFFEDPQFLPEDLEKLIADKNYEEGGKLSHLLKGVSGTLGAEDLFNASKNLEDILKGKKEGNIEESKNALLDLFEKTSVALKELLETL